MRLLPRLVALFVIGVVCLLIYALNGFWHENTDENTEETVRILQQNGGGAPGVSPALGIVLLAVFVSIAILLTGVIVVALFVADSDEPTDESPSSLSELLSDSKQIALESII
uniref:Uncharacterized protein n=1 Tax=Plectus sambesii TaxID=2011161 RepID=A0A914VI26_9BILA